MISLDTNILVYSTDMDDGSRQGRAIELLSSAARAGAGLTEQALIEFVSVAIRKSRLTVERTGTLVRGWLASFTLLTPGATLVEDTLDLLARYNLSAWDARLLAVCGRHSCKILLSEDLQDGANYNGVRVINPFLDKNMRLLSEVLVS